MVNDDWVRAAAPVELESLASNLLDGKIGPTFTSVSVEAAGFAPATQFLRSVRGIDPKVIAWALRSIARERRKATGKPFP